MPPSGTAGEFAVAALAVFPLASWPCADNIAQVLINIAKRSPELPAVTCGDRIEMTYGEVATRAMQLAAGLRSIDGVGSGERVVIFMGNRSEYVECLFAIWLAGLIAVPVNAKLHPRELAYIIDHCGARVCLADSDHAQAASTAITQCSRPPRLAVVADTSYRILVDHPSADPVTCDADDTAWLFYTSGTTGFPKGAMLTHRNLYAMTLNYFCDMDTIEPGDAIIHAAPLSHGSGLWVLPHVVKGAVHVMPSSGGF